MADTRSFDERLIAAMGEMVNPTKSATAEVPTRGGGRYTYKYETLDQVLAAVRPPLIKNGIGLTQKQVWDETTQQYVLQTIVFDAENCRILDQRPVLPFTDAQACGSWETYMRRYALRTAFALAGEDDDGKAAKDYVAQEPRNPTNHPLGKTTKHKPVDRRKKMLARVTQLRMTLMERGLSEDGLNAYLIATYEVDSADKLTDEQLVDYGKQLAKTVDEYQGKEEADVD